jgi:hypothetical protein
VDEYIARGVQRLRLPLLSVRSHTPVAGRTSAIFRSCSPAAALLSPSFFIAPFFSASTAFALHLLLLPSPLPPAAAIDLRSRGGI